MATTDDGLAASRRVGSAQGGRTTCCGAPVLDRFIACVHEWDRWLAQREGGMT